MLGRRQAARSGRCIRRDPPERGQVLILWILVFTVILVMGAIVVDVGLWLTERRRAQLAADFAALAAASELRNSASAAEARGLEFAARNGFENVPNEVEVDVNTPYNGDPDMVEVTIKQGSPMLFAGIFDAGAFDIGARSVGRLGSGEAEPLDLVIILDRTQTMNGAPLTNAKEAAKQALTIFDDSLQHIALGVIAASHPSSPCAAQDPGLWISVPLSQGTDYRNDDGTLNLSSELVKRIDCLTVSTNIGTDLGSPITAAADELKNGRSNVKKAIILLTDGQANHPDPDGCNYANQQATAAKNQGVEIYTIGFGVSGITCNEDTSGPYKNGPVTELLADMATPPSDNESDCGTQSDQEKENTDRDHFFCEAKSDDLTPIFERIAEDLTQGYRLDE
jgi:hypothetical protein